MYQMPDPSKHVVVLSRKLFPRAPFAQFCDVRLLTSRFAPPAEGLWDGDAVWQANEYCPGIPGRGVGGGEWVD